MSNANDLRPGEYKHIPDLGVYRAKDKTGRVDAFKSEDDAKAHTQKDPFKGLSSRFRSASANKKTNLYGRTVSKKFNASPKFNVTKEEIMREAANSKKDPREYGYEGEMAMSQLKGILMHAEQLHDMLEPDTDLPEWVQSKITLAYDYIQTAADYMATELDEALIGNQHKIDANKNGKLDAHDFKLLRAQGEPPVKKKLKTFKRFTAEATMGIGAVGRGSWSSPENAANRKKLADDFEQATYRKGKKFQPPGHKNNVGHGHHWMSHKGREYHWSGEGTEVATGKKSYQYSHTSEDGRSEHRAWVNQDGKITED